MAAHLFVAALSFSEAPRPTRPHGTPPRLAAFLKMGWARYFECRISAIKPEAHYEDQIHVTIRVVRCRD